MPVAITVQDIVIRLVLAAAAGALLGFNRGERGRPAGLRTTLLVCLAAAFAMIQANLLMDTAGKRQDSFVVLDLMRLPLGILSGMGFIGAGAIVRRGDLVIGVTTAATLWFVTVMGLCFGGGQIGLGLAALAFGLMTLWGMKNIEGRMRQEHSGTLLLRAGADGPGDAVIRLEIEEGGYRIVSWAVSYACQKGWRSVRCEVRWRARLADTRTPGFVDSLARRAGVLKLSWKP